MTSLLLLIASQAEGGLSADEAVAKGRAKATLLGFSVAGVEGSAERLDPVTGPVWRVTFPTDEAAKLTMDLAVRDGRLKGLTDTTYKGRELKGWTPRIARTQARAKTLGFARTLGFPASWAVGRTAFDGTGLNRWPEEAHATFEERPFGYRFLVEGNRAVVRLNPRTGALVGYELTDDLKTERSAVRLRPDQAGTIARKWRNTNRTDPRPRVEGPVRLGWALLGDGTRTARLVYDVPFRIESHWVDANNGRVVGGRRTRAVVPR